MKDKLLLLMKNEGLKPGQLAEMLEINPAGVSHILAGRNKPSFELLQKILRRFPRVNPDWLMLDAPNIYRDGEPATATTTVPTPDDTLFGSAATSESAPTAPTPEPSAAATSAALSVANLTGTTSSAAVARIVIFRTDGTFESFTPAK